MFLGDFLGFGSHVIGLAWNFFKCVWSSYCFGGYYALVPFLVRYVEFSFFLMYFVLVLVRAVLYPRRCMFYVWGPR